MSARLNETRMPRHESIAILQRETNRVHSVWCSFSVNKMFCESLLEILNELNESV